jgi:hypothetical protein
VTVTQPKPAASLAPIEPRRTAPVKLWATVGALLLALEVYLLGKWMLGPGFERVPSGPSDPPLWMKAVLNGVQGLGLVVMVALFWFLIVRPWRRDRRVTIDGIFCAVVFVCSPYDPLSNYFGHWLTYNSYMLNFGSIMTALPGRLAVNGPGATQAWPVLMMPACYVYVFLLLMTFGCRLLDKVRQRRPSLSRPALFGILFLTMLAVDLVLEGLLFMPLGFWSYPGGHWVVLARETYWRFPLQQALFFSLAFTSVITLRYFTDDRGLTVVERGIDTLRISPARQALVRFLAVLGATQLLLFGLYHLPQGLFALKSDPWPADLQKRSYLTDYVCGDGTDQACPGPHVPIPRLPSVHLDPHGAVVTPPGATPPTFVPFARPGSR